MNRQATERKYSQYIYETQNLYAKYWKTIIDKNIQLKIEKYAKDMNRYFTKKDVCMLRSVWKGVQWH